MSAKRDDGSSRGGGGGGGAPSSWRGDGKPVPRWRQCFTFSRPGGGGEIPAAADDPRWGGGGRPDDRLFPSPAPQAGERQASATRHRVKADAYIFESPSSWNVVGRVARGQIATVVGPPSEHNGYVTVPIRPRGAMERDSLEPVIDDDDDEDEVDLGSDSEDELGTLATRDEEAEKREKGEDDFFAGVLHELEICQERETLSVAGSFVAPEDDGFDLDDSWDAVPQFTSDRLTDVLRQLRRRKLPGDDDAMRLLALAGDHFRATASTLVHLPAPKGRLVIVGDLHGHLNDLLRLLDTYGEPSEENQYLFNGDFVDRGDWGPEVLLSLFSLRLLHPRFVHLNRGNHESQMCTERYGFGTQLVHTFPKNHRTVNALVHKAFDQLPLCHVVGSAVFVCHAGLPPNYVSLAEIEAVQRGPPPEMDDESPQATIFHALLWSDPDDTTEPSHRGLGWLFDRQVTKRFLDGNGLHFIVRSHECVPTGLQFKHAGLVATVFSASNYGGLTDGNYARVALLQNNLQLKPGNPWIEPYVKAGWVAKVVRKPAPGESPVVYVREWDTDAAADEAAVQVLQSRVGDVDQWQCKPKVRVLEELRRMIFLHRTELLEAFEAVDRDRIGRLSPELWAEAMSTCLETGRSFPWLALFEHLNHSEPDGRVIYMDFLSRYDNTFSRWLADRWCKSLTLELGRRLQASACEEFDQLDRSNRKKLSYSDLRPLLHNSIPQTATEAAAQSMHCFALLRSMDPKRTGFVHRADFLRIISEAAKQIGQCPMGHVMAHMKPFAHSGRMCNNCNRDIPRTNARHRCQLCDYDICELCFARGEGLSIPELRKTSQKRKASLGGTKVQMQWDNVEVAIRVLCRGHCNVRALFSTLSVVDGHVGKEEFVRVMTELLRDDARSAETLWTLASEHCGRYHAAEDGDREGRHRRASIEDLQQGTGRLRVADFERCLDVLDTVPSVSLSKN